MGLGRLPAVLGFLWKASRGSRLRPWRSPYLRWRVETYWGTPAETLDRQGFLHFAWAERARLWRFLVWAADMRRLARG